MTHNTKLIRRGSVSMHLPREEIVSRVTTYAPGLKPVSSAAECNATTNSYYAAENSAPITVSQTQMKREMKENGRG